MDKKQIKENIVKIRKNGIKLWTEDGKLRFKAPKGAMNDEFLSFLKDNKADVIKALDEENGIVLTEDVENRYETFPLTDIQSAYLLGRRQDFAYGGVACHIYMEIKYNCEFDTERAAGVWQKIYEHHEMLHSVINRDGYQVILKNFSKLNVNCYDFEKTDNSGEKFSQIRRELSHKIYDTEKEPLFTVAFSKFTDKTIMHFSIEFIIADWMSIWTILSQFEELYFGKVQKLTEVDVSFRDYVISASKIKDTISYENDKEYWMKKIDSIPKAPALPLNINTDKNKYSDKVTFERKNMSLSKTKWDNFKSICGKFGITPTSAVMTAYAYVLERWSRNKKFSINMTVLNRLPLHENIGRVIGDFTSVDIVDVDMSKNESFIDYGKQVNKTLFENLDHRLFSGVEVIRELSRKKGGDYAFMPIVFTSAIGLINNDMTNLKGDLSYGISQTPQVFIDCQVMDGVFGLQVNWDVRKGVFEETVIDDMFSIFEKLLNDLSVSKENWEKNEALKLPQWQEKLYKDVNNTAKELPRHLIHSKILECAAKTPDRIALADENGTVTYGDMIDKAEKLAAEIVLSGAVKNDIVAIIVEKSIDQIIAAIAALIAGCTYLPLDVTQGEKRRNYILEETKCKYLFSLKKYGFDFDKNIKAVYLDKFDYVAPVKTKEFPVADENSLAYIIYTSGSTGNPKGVAVSHKAAVNTIEDINMRYNVTENDVVLNIAQLNFDLSVYDIFGLLSVGGTVVVPSVDKYTNPAHWKKIITKYKVSVWNSVPSFMQMFTVLKNETNEDELDSIRLVMLSGDWIPVSLPNEIMSMARNARIVSLGGATEASIWSIYHEYEAEDADKVSIPYGKPLYNQGYKVLDEKLNDCPVFTAGELYITGTGLADEYYLSKELTEKSFFIHPVTFERVYRTGDFGRYMPNGDIEFLGRKDSQVKVKGFRIELTEIESIIKNYEGIINAAVVVSKSGVENKIFAYAEADESKINKDEFMEYLKSSLTSYMIPSVIKFVDSLPLSQNGKIDRKKLIEMASDTINERIGNTENENMTELEKSISELFSEAIGCSFISAGQNLYEMGADSLIMAQSAGKIRNEYIPDVSFDSILSNILNSPTVRGIAAYIENITDSDKKNADISDNTQNTEDSINENIFIKKFSEGNEKAVVVIHSNNGDLESIESEIDNIVSDSDEEVIFIGVKNKDYFCSLSEQNAVEILGGEYADEIMKCNKSSYRFIGYNIGGAVAVEAASRLLNSDVEVSEVEIIEYAEESKNEIAEKSVLFGKAEPNLYMGNIAYKGSDEGAEKWQESCLGEFRRI